MRYLAGVILLIPMWLLLIALQVVLLIPPIAVVMFILADDVFVPLHCAERITRMVFD